MPKIFEFRKVLAFRSILDSRFLKGKISQVVCLSIPLLFFPIQGCSTLLFYTADQPKSYVNLQTVKWAPEPDFYGDDALPGKKLTDHLLNHRKVFLEEELHPDRNDFLEELSRSFELDHYLDNRRVQQEISRLQQNPSYLESLQPRLERYLPFICEKVLSRNLPGELCLIPIIESSLDPFAFSSGGAAGLWQFIPSTAKRYGLKIDWWVDERRDLFAST
ncbi:MAG: transglycosylase SLT domain-containing protein, partial [Pseudomonadota bacterium]|nr:transglycosylase SLT domain-containing protein [Pseudomonadota bacterium]